MRLGSGGMGDVYRARDRLLERPVAVKVPTTTITPASAERFKREARAAARLNHPNVVAVYDWGGGTEPVHRHGVRRGPQPPGRAPGARARSRRPRSRAIGAQIADALAHAHHHGVVHRDVKPSNVLLTPGGSVKVTDFGIAQSAAGEALTEPGVVLGTRRLPLARAGRRASRPTPAATSTRSASSSPSCSPANGPPAATPTPSTELERVIARARAADPSGRHQIAAELRDELRAVDAGAPRRDRAGRRATPRRAPARRSPRCRSPCRPTPTATAPRRDRRRRDVGAPGRRCRRSPVPAGGRSTVTPPPRTSRPGEAAATVPAGEDRRTRSSRKAPKPVKPLKAPKPQARAPASSGRSRRVAPVTRSRRVPVQAGPHVEGPALGGDPRRAAARDRGWRVAYAKLTEPRADRRRARRRRHRRVRRRRHARRGRVRGRGEGGDKRRGPAARSSRSDPAQRREARGGLDGHAHRSRHARRSCPYVANMTLDEADGHAAPARRLLNLTVTPDYRDDVDPGTVISIEPRRVPEGDEDRADRARRRRRPARRRAQPRRPRPGDRDRAAPGARSRRRGAEREQQRAGAAGR